MKLFTLPLKLAFVLGLVIWLFLLYDVAYPLDRCQEYVADVRVASYKVFGIGYPYQYNIGQMQQESGCRANITSFDSGLGLVQVMPATVTKYSNETGMKFDPYNPEHAVRMQSMFLFDVWSKSFEKQIINFRGHKLSPKQYNTKCGKRLSWMYTQYNGGVWWLYEARKANDSCDRHEVMKACSRGGAWVGSGSKKRFLSFCQVNYAYAQQVETYAKKYRVVGVDNNKWRYW